MIGFLIFMESYYLGAYIGVPYFRKPPTLFRALSRKSSISWMVCSQMDWGNVLLGGPVTAVS